jgi:hypothetical protein
MAPNKLPFLTNLQALKYIIGDHHWITGGDLNIITSLDEKRGGLRRMDQASRKLNEIILSTNLINLPFSNGVHT